MAGVADTENVPRLSALHFIALHRQVKDASVDFSAKRFSGHYQNFVASAG